MKKIHGSMTRKETKSNHFQMNVCYEFTVCVGNDRELTYLIITGFLKYMYIYFIIIYSVKFSKRWFSYSRT